MAICILIYKCGEVGDQHVYCVRDVDSDADDFYVALSAGKKVISFYRDSELKLLLRMIDMENPDEKISVPEISTKTVCCVLRKCLEALDNNSFPLKMSYQA